MSCELHTQFQTLKVTSPELGIGPLSSDTDLAILQLREITGRWKPGRIATDGHSEVLFLFLYGEVSGCSVLMVLREFDPGATPDMLTWCFREYMLRENQSKWKQATTFVLMLHYIYYFFNNEQTSRDTFRSFKGYKRKLMKVEAEGIGLVVLHFSCNSWFLHRFQMMHHCSSLALRLPFCVLWC